MEPVSFSQALSFSDSEEDVTPIMSLFEKDDALPPPNPVAIHTASKSLGCSPGNKNKRPPSTSPFASYSPEERARRVRGLQEALLPTFSGTPSDTPSTMGMPPLQPSPTTPEKARVQHQEATPPQAPRVERAPKINKHMYKKDPNNTNYRWSKVKIKGGNPVWKFQGQTYQVNLIGYGEFHKVYEFVGPNRTIDIMINTRTPSPLSLTTNRLVLRVLNLQAQEKEIYETEKLKELRSDNKLDAHCFRQKIPVVRKITSFVPGGIALPFCYVDNHPNPRLGWELCARVNSGEAIKRLCSQIQGASTSSITELTSPQHEAGSAKHLFKWLLTEWKAHVAYMIETSVIARPLGKPRVGDFLPRNIGYDPTQSTFVYIDLKLEEDADFALKESLTGFLGPRSPTNLLRLEVEQTLLAHARKSGASQDFLSRLASSFEATK